MLTAKQERFAQLIASEGISQVAAYVDAGYQSAAQRKTLTEGASRLAADSNILARVEEIRATARDSAGITLEKHLARLDEIGKAALSGEAEVRDGQTIKVVKNYGAAVAAEIARGKHSGVAAADKHQTVEPDVSAEEAVKDLCSQHNHGVLHEIAYAHFMQGLEALKTPYNPEEADIPEPTQQAPGMVH